MFDAVISHQSGTTLQVAGASPTAVDQTQEHFFFFLFHNSTPSRVTAAFQANSSCSEPQKTSCATDPRGWKLQGPEEHQLTPTEPRGLF